MSIDSWNKIFDLLFKHLLPSLGYSRKCNLSLKQAISGLNHSSY